TAALAGCELPEALVGPDPLARLVDDRAGLRRKPMSPEERAVVVVSEEACLLSLGTVRSLEACLGGLGARLDLRLLAEREPDPSELTRVESRQPVALCLSRGRRPGGE